MRRQFSVDEFQSTRFQIFQLTSIIREAEDRKRRNWPDDAEVLKAYVSALSSTKTVLEEEQAQLLQKLDLIDVKTERLDPTKRQALASTKSEVQEKLRDFKQRIQDDETRIQQAEYILSNGVKPEEKSMIEDQITILKVLYLTKQRTTMILGNTKNVYQRSVRFRRYAQGDWRYGTKTKRSVFRMGLSATFEATIDEIGIKNGSCQTMFAFPFRSGIQVCLHF